MTSKQVTSPPWNSRRLVHSKEMAWASRWSVALRAFYKQILSSSNCKDFFFKWHRPPRKLAKEVFVKFIPAKEKTRFAKEWRKVLAKDHVIRIDSHEVFNTAQLYMYVHEGNLINLQYPLIQCLGRAWGICTYIWPRWHGKCRQIWQSHGSYELHIYETSIHGKIIWRRF